MSKAKQFWDTNFSHAAAPTAAAAASVGSAGSGAVSPRGRVIESQVSRSAFISAFELWFSHSVPRYPRVIFERIVDQILLGGSTIQTVDVSQFAEFLTLTTAHFDNCLQFVSNSLLERNGHVVRWFHGYMERDPAVQLLAGYNTFLVRLSSNAAAKGQFQLMYHAKGPNDAKGVYVQLPITPKNDVYWMTPRAGAAQKSYPTLMSAVADVCRDMTPISNPIFRHAFTEAAANKMLADAFTPYSQAAVTAAATALAPAASDSKSDAKSSPASALPPVATTETVPGLKACAFNALTLQTPIFESTRYDLWKGVYADRSVIIKLYNQNDRHKGLFLNELKYLTSIHDPHIAVLEAATVLPDPGLALVLTCLYGGAATISDVRLHDALAAAHSPHPPPGSSWLRTTADTTQLAIDLCTALAALHKPRAVQTGTGVEFVVAHGDVNPINCHLNSSHRLQLAGFEFARTIPVAATAAAAAGDAKSNNTASAAASGDALVHSNHPEPERYLAPELLPASERARATPASDMWSFGVVLWRLWSHAHPYSELKASEVGAFVDTSGWCLPIDAKWPEPIQTVITGCGQTKPSARMSATVALNHLSTFAESLPARKNPYAIQFG